MAAVKAGEAKDRFPMVGVGIGPVGEGGPLFFLLSLSRIEESDGGVVGMIIPAPAAAAAIEYL